MVKNTVVLILSSREWPLSSTRCLKQYVYFELNVIIEIIKAKRNTSKNRGYQGFKVAANQNTKQAMPMF